MNESRRQILLDTPHTETATGAIASFETDMVGRAKEVKVEIEPVQEGTPWIADTTESVPYNFRAVKGTAPRIGNSIFESVVGGTLAWNQLAKIDRVVTESTRSGITYSADGSGIVRMSGKNTDIFTVQFGTFEGNVVGGHVYYAALNDLVSSGVGDIFNIGNWQFTFRFGTLTKASVSKTITDKSLAFRTDDKQRAMSGVYHISIFDLTQMFGSTIADYLYSLETATPGAGVAWFRKLFPEDYYAYNPGELISVEGVSSHETVGFNAWDKSQIENGYVNDTNGATGGTSTSKNTGFVQVVGGMTYYIKTDATTGRWGAWYDANKNYITGCVPRAASGYTVTAPQNAAYMRMTVVYNNNNGNPDTFCINLSDPARNGTYEPYAKRSYPLDDSLTLRGIPKLDANNRLYYDGDTYESGGKVTRRYAEVTLNNVTSANIGGFNADTGSFRISTNLFPGRKYMGNIFSTGWRGVTSGMPANMPDKSIYIDNSQSNVLIYCKDSAFIGKTTAEVAESMNGRTFVYELAEPTTETANPFQSPQVIDEYGTEEYVYSGTRDVAIPVGHVTRHADIYPISGWGGLTVEARGKNLFDKADTSKQINAYIYGDKITSSSNRLVVFIPCKPSTAYTVSRLAVVTNERLYVAESTDFPAVGVSISNVVGAPTSQTTGNKMSLSITTSSSAKYLVVWAYWAGETTALDTLQIEKGSTATSYEPYTGSTTPISWADEAGTVYGGTLAWEKDGTVTLTKTMASVDLGTLTPYKAPSNVFAFHVSCPTNGGVLCSDYSTGQTGLPPASGLDKTIWTTNSIGSYYPVIIKDSAYADATVKEFKTAMDGVQLVYELATPQTYTLTPQEALIFLRGTNHVWNDINDTSVTYWTHKTGDSV